MYKKLTSFGRGAFGSLPYYEEIRQSFRRRHKIAYVYPNGVAPPFFWKFQVWRQTGEYACFYRQRLVGPFGSWTETYVWVFRKGHFVEVSQQGIRGATKRNWVRG